MTDLAREVAEKVMGWTKTGDRGVWWKDGLWEHSVDGLWEHSVASWQPDTKIAQAWEVVEEMRRRGYELMLSEPEVGRWHASFFLRGDEDDEGHRDGSASAPTAKEAICKAALDTMAAIQAINELDAAALAAVREEGS